MMKVSWESVKGEYYVAKESNVFDLSIDLLKAKPSNATLNHSK